MTTIDTLPSGDNKDSDLFYSFMKELIELRHKVTVVQDQTDCLQKSVAGLSKDLVFSRTSYYNCKKEMSHNTSFTSLFLDRKWEKSLSGLDRTVLRNRISNSSTDTRIRSHNAWNDPEFVTKYSDRFFAEGYDLVDQTKRMSARINSQQDLSSKNFESVPSNATIRQEYVRCGSPYCSRCEHGPYYYAYWKEGRRLNKKYIGKYDPRKDSRGK